MASSEWFAGTRESNASGCYTVYASTPTIAFSENISFRPARAMLYFYCPPSDADLGTLAEQGLATDNDAPVRLYTRLADAQQAAGDGPVLVVDERMLPTPPLAADADHVLVAAVPPSAWQNVRPYYPPRSVTAAGGYVTCPLDDEVALLVIFRRGVWDLPKGKLDPGETAEECALREVREEVGIEELQSVRSLGTTQHGYARDERYAVKTTHWFLMRTPERTFAPERREGIRRVAWARWSVARRHIGYDTLRRHMDRCKPDVRAAAVS